jgi:hypothetical protein
MVKVHLCLEGIMIPMVLMGEMENMRSPYTKAPYGTYLSILMWLVESPPDHTFLLSEILSKGTITT